MSYREEITKLSPLTFRKIIAAARDSLPVSVRRTPWIGLSHGVELLEDNQLLNQYLAAYGLMHEEKVRMALTALGDAANEFSGSVTVVDWGCGQALATCCFFDWLVEQNIGTERVRCVNLIEPSVAALARGALHVDAYLGRSCVRKVNKYLNDIGAGDLDTDNNDITIHFFSNILDIETVDIDRLAAYVTGTFHGRQVFCCMGPLNLGSSRIEEFASKLGIEKSNILKACRGKLSNVRGTISLLVFVKDEKKAEVLKTEFAPEIRPELMDTILLQRLIKKYPPKEDAIDRIVQYYQMVTELEQSKEPQMTSSIPFPFEEKAGGVLIVDLSRNKSFAEAFEKNRDKSRTKWPKDLHFGIDIKIEDTVYRLLHYVVPFDELKGFELKNNKLEVPLKGFSVSLGVAESLELDDGRVAELDGRIHGGALDWSALAKLVKEEVSDGAALSSQQL